MSTPPHGSASAARWLALQRAFALRPQHAVERLRSGDGPETLVPASAAADEAAAWARLRERGVSLLPVCDAGYPERLLRLPDAPPVLCVAGDAARLQGRCVAIVGARAATRAGLRMAHELARELARAGIVVVSGLARGIDAAAHEGALAGGGATLAVQACGIDRVYPGAHRALARRIEASGARISEFPPGTPALRHHFPLRNRLISGLAEAVVVVEARIRSGTLVTARLAADQGVDVLAVPGPVDSEAHQGALQLLREGAGIVLDASDVLGSLRPPVAPAPAVGEPTRGAPAEPLSPAARRVLRALAAGPRSRDALGRSLGLEAGQLALPLLELELRGRLEEARDGRLRRIDPRPRGRAGQAAPAPSSAAAGRAAPPGPRGSNG